MNRCSQLDDIFQVALFCQNEITGRTIGYCGRLISTAYTQPFAFGSTWAEDFGDQVSLLVIDKIV